MFSALVQSALTLKTLNRCGLVVWVIFTLFFTCLTVTSATAKPLHLGSSTYWQTGTNYLATSLTDKEANTTHFIAVGDTGSGNANQQAVATAMKLRYSTIPYQFVLHLGDIIYPVGNVDKDGERLYTNFYRYWYEDFKVPVWTTLGNHDVIYKRGKPALKFYQMPSYYYKNTLGNMDIFTLNTNNFDMKQQVWLKNGLQQSKAKWKLVYGHHPIGTSGEHSREKLVLDLQKTLLPTLAEGKADVYLAGHDHDYERFTPTLESPLLTLVSGGGGAYLRNRSEERIGSVKFIKAHHYLEGLADDKTLRLQALDVNNTPLDCVILKKTTAKLAFQSEAWKPCDQITVPFMEAMKQ